MTNPAADVPFSRLFSQFLRTWNYQPTTSWDHLFNPQFFINSNPDDVAVENDVLSQVGSYGKQLGTIIDALSVVVSKLAATQLTSTDQRVIDRFHDLSDEVSTVVARHRPDRDRPLSTADTEEFLDRLERLRHDAPAVAETVTELLRQAVEPRSISRLASPAGDGPLR
jgi:hypothetical protein